jgi:protoporphyrinogen oxidase
MEKKAIIIGAGPAGLTAAYELLKRMDIKPVILEKSGDIGGISKTVNYKGNRIDIGGHRFFSKSDRVMNWWFNIMPVQSDGQTTFDINYQNKSRKVDTASAGANAGADPDKVMLVRKRLSRIYFLRKFFTYPIQLSFDTLTKLGLWTTIAIMFSYLKAQLFPRKPENNLEDFMVNRFGKVLYNLFFKDYTEKVWGIPCNKISAEWGAQRIKGVSISKAIQHAIQSATKKKSSSSSSSDISQKDTETSLIEQFLYPKFGPGQLWEEVARQVKEMGGTILMHQNVQRIYTSEANNAVTAVAAINNITGETSYLEGDYFFSTMPVQELVGGMDGSVPDDVREVAAGLQYRDFITVGILLKQMSFQDKKTGEWKPLQLEDTWIYIQEKDVKVGRLQLFNNWSPYMVKDPDTVWVGMEFFCNTTDSFWQKTDEEIKQLAISELEKIGLASVGNVLDMTVLRVEKTYPAYFGTYERFDVVREYVDRFENLFLVGRNGMHKYNNSDHSMLTAMVAVDNITAGVKEKVNIWGINTEQEYHEEKDVIYQNPNTKSFPENEMEPSFPDFIFRNRENKRLIWISATLLLLQFAIFKILFPYANYMPDSYSYLNAAMGNLDINTWPIGYSKFLRLFSAFTHSDLVLVLFQYLLMQFSLLFLAFTVYYIFKPRKTVLYIAVAFVVFNPLFAFMSNYISADSVFTGLSVLWFTTLIWMLYRPRKYQIWVHGFLILLLFTVRYNALYYPVIAIGVIFSASFSIREKIKGVAIFSLLIFVFMWHNGNKYGDLTGVRQFSPFGSWQLASNALFMYSRMDYRRDKVPTEFERLNNSVKHHIDSLRRLSLNQRPDSTLGIYYLWEGPLRSFIEENKLKDSTNSYFKKWAAIAPYYKRYGQYMIFKHPDKYFMYFILPNTINYFAPPSEFLGIYNMKSDSVNSIAKTWFGYKSQRVKSYTKEVTFLKYLQGINAGVNIAFIFSALGFILFGLYNRFSEPLIQILGVVAAFYLCNLVFSISASPVVLRYQMFPMAICLIFSLLIGDRLLSMLKQIEQSKQL